LTRAEPVSPVKGHSTRRRCQLLPREDALYETPLSIVDDAIIAAPSSTKNSKGEWDPEMHETRRGNQWYFDAKTHIGVDSTKKGIVQSDVHMLPDLLHGAGTTFS